MVSVAGLAGGSSPRRWGASTVGIENNESAFDRNIGLTHEPLQSGNKARYVRRNHAHVHEPWWRLRPSQKYQFAKVSIQGKQNAKFSAGTIEDSQIARAGLDLCHPDRVVCVSTQCAHDSGGHVLIRQPAHV